LGLPSVGATCPKLLPESPEVPGLPSSLHLSDYSTSTAIVCCGVALERRPLNTEFYVNAVSVCIDIEKLTSNSNGSWGGAFGIMDALQPYQSTGKELSCKMLVSIYARLCKQKGGSNLSKPSP